MNEIFRLLTNENFSLIMDVFNFYLPPLYRTILQTIQLAEKTPFLGMLIGYNTYRTLPILFATYPRDQSTHATRRLLTLNRIEWKQVKSEILYMIITNTCTSQKSLKLIGIMKPTKEILSVIVLTPKPRVTFEQFLQCMEILEQTCSTYNERYKILLRNIPWYDIHTIQMAIDYENSMIKSQFKTFKIKV